MFYDKFVDNDLMGSKILAVKYSYSPVGIIVRSQNSVSKSWQTLIFLECLTIAIFFIKMINILCFDILDEKNEQFSLKMLFISSKLRKIVSLISEHL